MATNIFSIGISGLRTAQINLMVTSHNITNASTPGYHRQVVSQVANPPQNSGAGFIGQGVDANNVSRVYDRYLDLQVMQAESQAGYFAAYEQQISQIDNLIADSGTSVSPALQDYFKTLQNLTAHPENPSSRQAVISAANALASRFQLVDGRLSEIREGVNNQVQNAVAEINSYASQIAQLNRQIADAMSLSTTQMPNDLYDMRDELVTKLNEWVKATTVPDGRGGINVFIGNGQSLVNGQNASQLIAKASLTDPERLDIYYDQPEGQPDVIINPNMLAGGKLGGLLDFRDEALVSTQNSLGRMAITLATSMNEQHQLGVDLQGQPGGILFNVASPRVAINGNNTGSAEIAANIVDVSDLTTSDYEVTYDGTQYNVLRLADRTTTSYASLPQTVDGLTLSLASGAPNAGDSFLVQPTRSGARNIGLAISNPSELAVAAPIRAGAANSNTGTGAITPGSVNPGLPLNANLTQPVTITFTSATTFSVSGTGTGNPTGVSYSPGADISYNGWSVQISGAVKPGDTFTIGPNSSGVADSRNAAELADLQVANLLNNGTANLQSAYAQLVSEVGNRTREMQINNEAQDALVTQSRTIRDSFSGVNLDEEAANLMRYQQAYQAAAKVMQSAQEMFSLLLDLGR